MAMVLAVLALFVAIPAPACSMGLEESLARLAFAPCAPRSAASIPGRLATPATCSLSPPASGGTLPFPGFGRLPQSSYPSAFLPSPRLAAAHAPAPRVAARGLMALRAGGAVIEPVEGERDYRAADLAGTRLFVTGLPATVPPPPSLISNRGPFRGRGVVIFSRLNLSQNASGVVNIEGRGTTGRKALSVG